MFVDPKIEEINKCPTQVLSIAEAVSRLISDIRESVKKEQHSQFPLYIPRIGYLEDRITKQTERIRSLIEDVKADDRLMKDADITVAVLEQQISVLERDRNELRNIKDSLSESYSKLGSVKQIM